MNVQMERCYPHPLRAIDTCENPFKPWLDTTAAELADRRLALWQSFVDRALPSDAIHVAAERGEAIGVRFQTDWKLAFPYATHRGLAGLEGLAQAYVDYRALTDRLFGQLPLDKVAIENQSRDWAAGYAAIERTFAAEPGAPIAAG